jgi:hypothetical protein
VDPRASHRRPPKGRRRVAAGETRRYGRGSNPACLRGTPPVHLQTRRYGRGSNPACLRGTPPVHLQTRRYGRGSNSACLRGTRHRTRRHPTPNPWDTRHRTRGCYRWDIRHPTPDPRLLPMGHPTPDTEPAVVTDASMGCTNDVRDPSMGCHIDTTHRFHARTDGLRPRLLACAPQGALSRLREIGNAGRNVAITPIERVTTAH